jgi:hypothetical protein
LVFDEARLAGADPVAPVAADERRIKGGDLKRDERNVRRVALAEVGHVLRLGTRAVPKVDLANGTGHRGNGGGAKNREGWETEAEGSIDGTGMR